MSLQSSSIVLRTNYILTSITEFLDERWLMIDNNELFVIRNDSLKKSYDIMINKISRERMNKRVN